MHNKQESQNFLSRTTSQAATLALATVAVFLLAPVLTQSAEAQTYTVIHTFTTVRDAALPQTGMTIDAAGNLYGTTEAGGAGGNGTVFKLAHVGSGWIRTTLHTFAGGNDGILPSGEVILAPDGSLYGVTKGGGGNGCNGWGCGTVFHLTPPLTAPKSSLAPWNETVLYRFSGGNDGAGPTGDLTFDQAGNIYGTTFSGGSLGWGAVYKLTKSGGGWTETVLYSAFESEAPVGGVVFDISGNLYGIFSGAPGRGAVYQLSPSGATWSEQTLKTFNGGGNDGEYPAGGLIIDTSGNLSGTTTSGGSGGGGTVFELLPADGGWTFSTLYGLPYNGPWSYPGPWDKLVRDAAGNLYGTTQFDGAYGEGNVFRLTSGSGSWTYTSVHDFTGGTDGRGSLGSVVFDANGNLYGTATQGGDLNCYPPNGCGVVFKITP